VFQIFQATALNMTDVETDSAGRQGPIDWAAVVQDNQDWMRRVIVARTDSADLADDIVQEVGLAVIRSQSRPDRADEIAPWLCKIVVRQCALAARSQVRQRRKLDGFRQARAETDCGQGDPMLWLLDQEQRELLRRAMDLLDPQGRQLLIWKYVQGMSYRDIAARLAVSMHAAEYRVIDARKQLRRRLHDQGIEGGEVLP
jgi:RNA polymerase sigma factor (sigma-70 family)